MRLFSWRKSNGQAGLFVIFALLFLFGFFLTQNSLLTLLTHTVISPNCTDRGYFLRSDITFLPQFAGASPEYGPDPADEKFCLGGDDKDLSSKRMTMNQIGTVNIGGVEKQLWRCHTVCGTIAGCTFLGTPIKYVYVLEDEPTFTMDVYIAEGFWDDPSVPRDGSSTEGSFIPIDDISVDYSKILDGVMKQYILGPSTKSMSVAEINQLNHTPIDTANVGKIGTVDVYEYSGDTTHNILFAVKPPGTNIFDGATHDMYVLAFFIPGTATGTTKDSLQLRNMRFIQITFDRWWTPDCKPAIYLYPEQTTNAHIQVFPKGELTETIPPYPNGGWRVTAFPTGKIASNGKTFPYLYYEAKITDDTFKKPSQGFVVTKNNLVFLYSALLPKLGLNEQETADFIAYWEDILPPSPYYFVGILDDTTIDYIEPISISPIPDVVTRVRLYFEPLLTWKPVIEPVILAPKKRSGFTVIEWGGMVKLHRTETFTCSM